MLSDLAGIMEELAYTLRTTPPAPQDQAHARASHMYCVFLWSVGEPLRVYLTA
jgi:hypothetical protein